MVFNNNPQVPDTHPVQNADAIANNLMYKQNQESFDLIHQVFTDFSIPLDLRQQFYVFWNNIILGNYTPRDIEWLMLKFNEWRIHFLWYIPDVKWNNAQVFDGDSTAEGDSKEISIDLNMLLNSLEQLFFINLTRGRDGFTMKWLHSTRGIVEVPGNDPKKRRWF